MTTNFNKVVDFNVQYGIIPSKDLTPNPDIFDNQIEIKSCLKLIKEETEELYDAVNNRDYVEAIDAIADLLYVTYGMGARLGMDMDAAFSLVHDNNMTKFCVSEENAQASVKYYEENMDKLGYKFPKYKKAPDDVHWVVYDEKPYKVLKSISWEKVDLKDICKKKLIIEKE